MGDTVADHIVPFDIGESLCIGLLLKRCRGHFISDYCLYVNVCKILKRRCFTIIIVIVPLL